MPRLIDGPYPSIAAYCEARGCSEVSSRLDDESAGAASVELAPPFQQVAYLSDGDFYMGLRVGRSWFITEAIGEAFSKSRQSVTEVEVRNKRLFVRYSYYH